MKQTILILSFVVFSLMALGQVQVPLSLISTSGGIGQATINNTTQTVEWTIGETFIGYGTASNQVITIGEQQNIPGDTTTSITNVIFAAVKVYPNPAHSYVTIVNMPCGSKTISLNDIEGKTIQSITTQDNSQTLSTSNLASGIYTLTLRDYIGAHVTYKISITNN